MRFKDLPISEIVGAAAGIVELTLLLERAVRAKGFFVASEEIEGSPFYGKILSTSINPRRSKYPSPPPRVSVEVARDLLDLAPKIHYPAANPNQGPEYWDRGWEVRRAVHKKEIFVIVFPTWINPMWGDESEFQFELEPQ